MAGWCTCRSKCWRTSRRISIEPWLPRSREGLPAVRGEDVGEDTGGYHFYPADEQIREWLGAARMQIVEDMTDMTYGDWGYRHLLLRTLNPRPGTPDEARSDP